LDNDFRHTLYEMMQELTNALKGGGDIVADTKNFEAEASEVEVVTETEEETVAEDFSAENEDMNNESSLAENNIDTEDSDSSFAKKEEEEDSKEE